MVGFLSCRNSSAFREKNLVLKAYNPKVIDANDEWQLGMLPNVGMNQFGLGPVQKYEKYDPPPFLLHHKSWTAASQSRMNNYLPDCYCRYGNLDGDTAVQLYTLWWVTLLIRVIHS